MAPVSRLESQFERFLRKCETLISRRDPCDWRLQKYIEALNEQLNQLKSTNVLRPSEEQLKEYTKKVNFLKGVLQVEKLENSSQKLLATQLLSPVASPSQEQHSKAKEIYLQSQTKYATEIRNELFGKDGTEVRQRVVNSGLSEDDVDAMLRHQQSVQEKCAEEMLVLTRNLKENALMAKHIIKKDIECLENSAKLAGKNFDNLRQSSDIVSDFVKRSCQYWLWIMLALVSLTFLWMVVFIRLFPKK
ncbi:vesicle transport protein USE1-like protein [Dinothrombium tinctorium]|uniref:Vesicle transport protein USE1 n=1 Tax=Dinothrombium tinctorium TaxID=1965070 RepID=A0A3S3NLR5_9ACAR|nr:vesicle transport protein USE1-like protein [Dinothrombium tinctorium]